MKDIRMNKHYFQDTLSNEIFYIESSFAIPQQALRASPKFKLAMFDNSSSDRFEYLKSDDGALISIKKRGDDE